MKWLLPFGVMLARRFSPQELVDLAVKVWPQVWQKVPPDQRMNLLDQRRERTSGRADCRAEPPGARCLDERPFAHRGA